MAVVDRSRPFNAVQIEVHHIWDYKCGFVIIGQKGLIGNERTLSCRDGLDAQLCGIVLPKPAIWHFHLSNFYFVQLLLWISAKYLDPSQFRFLRKHFVIIKLLMLEPCLVLEDYDKLALEPFLDFFLTLAGRPRFWVTCFENKLQCSSLWGILVSLDLESRVEAFQLILVELEVTYRALTLRVELVEIVCVTRLKRYVFNGIEAFVSQTPWHRSCNELAVVRIFDWFFVRIIGRDSNG